MKNKLKYYGRTISIIGLYCLFLKVKGGSGFGGPTDNSIEIILLSSFILGIGLFLIYLSQKFKQG